MATAHDMLTNADTFKAAYPSWPGTETLAEPKDTPLFVAAVPDIHQCEPVSAYMEQEGDHLIRVQRCECGAEQVSRDGGVTWSEWEAPCPDCEAAPRRRCYPDCLRYAEGV